MSGIRFLPEHVSFGIAVRALHPQSQLAEEIPIRMRSALNPVVHTVRYVLVGRVRIPNQ